MKKLIPALLLLAPPAFADATVAVRLLSDGVARQVVAAAVDHCAAAGYSVAAVLTARDGRPQAMLRHALAAPVTLKIAEKKAYTAANMRQPSAELQKPLARASRRLTRLNGGLPLEAGGQFYGGIGVSGATGEVDAACAQAGIDAVRDELEFAE